MKWASGKLSTGDMMIRGMMTSYDNSADRNLYMFNMLDSGKGRIDPEYMKMMYRIGGKLPEGPFDKIVKDYQKTGDWGEVTTAHASNAITTVMKPSDGLFSLCTGPAKAGMKPLLPGSILPIYRETNAFFEIKLEETPEDMLRYTRDQAQLFISQAEELYDTASFNENTMKMLKSYLIMAQGAYSEGLSKGSELYDTARAIRAFTRAQVRARQVINAINPPPSSPNDL